MLSSLRARLSATQKSRQRPPRRRNLVPTCNAPYCVLEITTHATTQPSIIHTPSSARRPRTSRSSRSPSPAPRWHQAPQMARSLPTSHTTLLSMSSLRSTIGAAPPKMMPKLWNGSVRRRSGDGSNRGGTSSSASNSANGTPPQPTGPALPLTLRHTERPANTVPSSPISIDSCSVCPFSPLELARAAAIPPRASALPPSPALDPSRPPSSRNLLTRQTIVPRRKPNLCRHSRPQLATTRTLRLALMLQHSQLPFPRQTSRRPQLHTACQLHHRHPKYQLQ